MPIVYLNGDFLPAEQAKVSVFDRGFLFGDGVYEVIPVFAGKLFRLHQHLARLQGCLDAIQLANPLTESQWEKMLSQLIEKNPGRELQLYLQVTRGAATRDHAFPSEIKQGIFAMANPIQHLPAKYFENGVAVISCEDNRWQRCNIKAISLLPNILLRQQAVDQGVTEAILIRDGIVTEGSASNVFIIKDNTIMTAVSDQRILPGITRDLIIELAAANSIPCKEMDITEITLKQADEIWITSSTKEILPVTMLNNQVVGEGKPGGVWLRMNSIYQVYKQSLLS